MKLFAIGSFETDECLNEIRGVPIVVLTAPIEEIRELAPLLRSSVAVVPPALRTFVDSIAAHETGTCSCPGDERGCFQTIIADWQQATKKGASPETVAAGGAPPEGQSIGDSEATANDRPPSDRDKPGETGIFSEAGYRMGVPFAKPQRASEAVRCACNCAECVAGRHDSHCDPRPRTNEARTRDRKIFEARLAGETVADLGEKYDLPREKITQIFVREQARDETATEMAVLVSKEAAAQSKQKPTAAAAIESLDAIGVFAKAHKREECTEAPHDQFHEGWLTGLGLAYGIAKGNGHDQTAKSIDSVVEHCPRRVGKTIGEMTAERQAVEACIARLNKEAATGGGSYRRATELLQSEFTNSRLLSTSLSTIESFKPLVEAARAVVHGRIPAVSAEREGSDWKHSRIADTLTDRLAEALVGIPRT